MESLEQQRRAWAWESETGAEQRRAQWGHSGVSESLDTVAQRGRAITAGHGGLIPAGDPGPRFEQCGTAAPPAAHALGVAQPR